MLLKANHTWAALEAEFEKIAPHLADSEVEGSSIDSIRGILCILRARHDGGVEAVRAQAEKLSATLKSLAACIAPITPPSLAAVHHQIARIEDAPSLNIAEDAWRAALKDFEALVIDLNTLALPAETRRMMLDIIVPWESSDLRVQTDARAAALAQPNSPITRESLQAYLRDRFNEPSLEVTALTALPGGFGKETTIFAAKGAALNGEFVIRRDLGAGLGVANDCHQARLEYPVIRAAFEHGFPAPEAIWIDTEHALLPGGDFIVMRRAPGKMGGSFFGATESAGPELADTLAGIAARLHTLPPLASLGDHASFIRGECWSMTRAQAARAYIQGWYDFVRGSDRLASPALFSIYRWLLDNVPDRTGRATLLHGDLGFHNFLFDDGKLTAVLDWEFAHVGDPAEELGYIAVTTGGALDFERFMASYVAAGGDPVDAKTLHFFKVWAYIRNASAANLQATLFQSGQASDLKLTVLPYKHIPAFIDGALALIQKGPD